MGPLEIHLYEATVEIFDDRYPLDVNPVSETTRIDFLPIRDSETYWADYHCRTVVRGGTMPSYFVAVPEGELFEVEFPMSRASADADDPPPVVRTFLRSPDLKAADGVVILCCCRYQQYGFRLIPFEGGKAVELLPDPLAQPAPPKKAMPRRPAPQKPTDAVSRADVMAALTVPEVPIKAKPPARRTVGQVIEHYKRLEAPVKHSGRTAQASLFAPEPEPELVNGRLPDGTLPGQMSFL